MRWYKINDDKTTELLSDYTKLTDIDFESVHRRVGDDTVDDQRISTVFLTMDHNWSTEEDAVPILFETMIFGGPYDTEMWRYSTYDEAKAGHDRIVNCLKEGTNPTL
jgi:hypothetical protein